MDDLLDIRDKISGVRIDVWVKLIYITRHLGLRRDYLADFNGFAQIFMFVRDEYPVSHGLLCILPTHLPSSGYALGGISE